MKVRWTADARAELASLTRYISQHSPSGARYINEAIKNALAVAQQYPEGCRLGRVEGTREIVAHPNYLVVYKVEADGIVVVAVLHSRREYPCLPPVPTHTFASEIVSIDA